MNRDEEIDSEERRKFAEISNNFLNLQVKEEPQQKFYFDNGYFLATDEYLRSRPANQRMRFAHHWKEILWTGQK